MARPIPILRNAQASRARAAKTWLLPMPACEADLLATHYRCALELMRTGRGYLEAAQTLTEMLLLTGFLVDAGYGEMSDEERVMAEQAISTVFDAGNSTGEWRLDEPSFVRFAGIANLHDAQLHAAPVSALAVASDRLDCFRTGQRYRAPQKKRA
jgi:hypothetical protein